MTIKKSNGSTEDFDILKVQHGIIEAFKKAKELYNDYIIDSIVNNLYLYENISSSEIRRQVEEALMAINKKVAKSYIQAYDDNRDLLKKQDFIKDYILASNAATGSKFDANANVTNKNIVTLGQELYKENNIKQNRYILKNKIKILYTKKLADQYIADLESHVLYKHDESGTPGYPYTYSSKEIVTVIYRGNTMLLPLDLLYNIVDSPEVLVDPENDVHQKYVDAGELLIKDKDNTYTNITVLTRKKRHRDLVRIKTSFGEDVVVTDNHPMITNKDNVDENTVEAINSEGLTQFKIDETLNFRNDVSYDLANAELGETFDNYIILNNGIAVKRNIEYSREFGYFVGFFVGDGNYVNSNDETGDDGCLNITQNNKETLQRLNNILFDTFGIVGKIRYKRDLHNCYTLHTANDAVWYMLSNVFKIQDKSWNKTLPINILETNEEFAKGILEGLIDSNGTVNKTQLSIRLASRSAILQATTLLRHFGYSVGNTIQNCEFFGGKSYKGNYTIWGVNCALRDGYVSLEKSTKWQTLSSAEETPKYKKSGETKITDVQVLKNTSFLDLNEYIYDLTTDTHSFACNNILVHNCVAITMFPFLTDGLTKLGGISVAPTDLKSYCGEFINLVYSVSSQFMGAVATPEFLMYMDYFIRKDYGDNYLERLDEVVDNTVKQRTLTKVIDNCFQQVVHSMNMPAGNRGYQCVREDTTQLATPNGFKYLSELNPGDECYVWKNGKIDIEPIEKLNVYDFDGELYQFKGRNYQQTVTDGHRVLYKVPNTNRYEIKEAKELFGHSKLSLPIGSNGVNHEDFAITDELLQLCVVALTDGSIDNYEEGNINSGRLTIYKSKNRWGYKEIPELLKTMGIGFTENECHTSSFGDMITFRIPQIESLIILRQIEHTKKSLPKFFKLLSKRQIDLVIDTWSKTDGHNNHGVKMLQCDNETIQNDLQQLVMLGGYGSEICSMKTKTFDGQNVCDTKYVKIFARKDKRVSEYNKIHYTGKVWCPSTDAGIVIFREENGVPYVSGNSVFWNVGYFDKPYFEGVFGEFVFPDGTKPKWETLSWLQKHFMRWFNNERSKYILTFPVETMALLTDGSDDFADKDYADFTAQMWADGHSFFCYLSDSPDSLSSCCFDGSEVITVKNDGETTLMTIKDFVNMNNAAIDQLGNTEMKTKTTIESYDPKTLTIKETNVTGTLKKQYTGKMYTINTENGSIQVTRDHVLMVKNKQTNEIEEITAEKLFENYDNYLVASDNMKFVSITKITCEDVSNKTVYDILLEENHYFSANNIITHNCRLRNSLKDNQDDEHNHTTHQYSMGTASVATGSKSVMSVNLPRLIQLAVERYYNEKGIEYKRGTQITGISEETRKEMYEYIKQDVYDMTERIHKYQTAFNETIKDFFKAGMLDVYNAGFIDMKKQYLTVGVNGITDAAEYMGLTVGNNEDYRVFVNNILETINICNKKDRTRECMFNTEFVPAENLAAKNYKWDRNDGFWVSPNRNLYSSYFYNPEDTQLTVIDKMKLHGKNYVQYLDGGSALHANLQEHLTQPQYRQLMKVAAKNGCNYFTFNVRNSVCNECGYISKHTIHKCPKCGSTNIDYLTRVIGYLKRISSFSEARQIEAAKRNYMTE